MDIVKTLLAGCGVLAILGMVGCVGLVGVGSYAVDQAIEQQNQERARDYAAQRDANGRRNGSTSSEDPFSDYQGNTSTGSGDEVGGWGDNAD